MFIFYYNILIANENPCYISNINLLLYLLVSSTGLRSYFKTYIYIYNTLYTYIQKLIESARQYIFFSPSLYLVMCILSSE